MLLLMIRHGSTALTGKRLTGRLPGVLLSREGRRQAESLADRLAAFPLAAIYSSPLERCLETAAPLAARHRRKVRIISQLGEVDYGKWQGRTFRSLYRTQEWKELRADPGGFRFPGGETIREAQTRALGEIDRLRRKHEGRAVAAVSHADLIRLIVAGYLGSPLDLYHRIVVPVASVTAVGFGERGPAILRLGDTGSFDDLVVKMDGARP